MCLFDFYFPHGVAFVFFLCFFILICVYTSFTRLLRSHLALTAIDDVGCLYFHMMLNANQVKVNVHKRCCCYCYSSFVLLASNYLHWDHNQDVYCMMEQHNQCDVHRTTFFFSLFIIIIVVVFFFSFQTYS